MGFLSWGYRCCLLLVVFFKLIGIAVTDVVVGLAPKSLCAHPGFEGVFCVISLYALSLFDGALETRRGLSVFCYFCLAGTVVGSEVGGTH